MTDLMIQPPDLADVLKEKLTKAVREHSAHEPRSLQVQIGASQIGNPCVRQLALKSLGYAPSHRRDPWATIIGKAVHSYLETVFVTANLGAMNANASGLPPWAVETRVEMAPNITGTCDLYDHELKTVIDHKVPADSTMEKVRKGHISETYRIQVQCYGYGFERLGYEVKHVALAFWPRGNGAWLGGVEVITFPYEPQVVHQALERWHDIVIAAIQLDLENHHERAAMLSTADGPCNWCPFWRRDGRPAVDGEGKPMPMCLGHKK